MILILFCLGGCTNVPSTPKPTQFESTPILTSTAPTFPSPTQISVTPTSLSPTSPTATKTPPIESLANSEVVDELETLLDQWQASMLNPGAGWIQIVTVTNYGQEEIILPNGARLSGNITYEQWLNVDQSGMVIASINIQRDQQDQPFQVSTFHDGISRNLTFGSQEPQTPYPAIFDYGLPERARLTPPEKQEIEWQNQQAFLYTFQEKSSTGEIQFEEDYIIDPQTGQVLYWESYNNTVPEQGEVIRKITTKVFERKPRPPAEIIAYFDQEISDDYQPLPPEGILAPPGFDPSNRKLTMVMIPGDDPLLPTRFYGDLYAGDYLIGRVDFGAVPGGWCDRSPDGRRIAFNYGTMTADYSSTEVLRWYSLIDRQVHNPLPALKLLSTVAWAPDSTHLAFSAYPNDDYEQRALFVFNTNTEQLTSLGFAAASPWPPLWSPDGNYVLSVSPDQNLNSAQLYAIDYRKGEIYYQGPFDLDLWQAAPDSPTKKWRIIFPRTQSGFDRCEYP